MTRHHFNILGLLFNCTLCALFLSNSQWMWIGMGLSSLLFFTFMTLGITLPNRNYFIRTKTRLKTDEVLLTFDDGPNEKLTPQVLEILKKHQIKALFFVIGDKVDKHPAIIKQALSEGHLIGNHTLTHPLMFAALRQEKVDKEIALCDNILIKHGIHPGNFFRPPVGYTNPRIARGVQKYNKRVIGWSLRSFDSVLKDESKLLQRLKDNIKPGQIVLLHDNLPQSIAILEEFILFAKQSGIIFANPTCLNSVKK